MIKEISLLLLLDYSGSMEQTFEGKVKVEMMRQNLRGIVETVGPTNNIGTLIYGSNPQLNCSDFREYSGNSKQIFDVIQSTKPGAFGKTPLADGIRRITKMAVTTKASQIITLTDGGDSCGQDPCKALIEADKELGTHKKSISLMLIAFDLKNEKSKLQCIKSLNLKNIKTSLIDADNEEQIYEGLLNAQKNSLGIDQNLSNEKEFGKNNESNASKEKDKNISNSNQNGMDAGDSNGSGAFKKNKNPPQNPPKPPKELIEKDEGIIEITGAPSEAEFEVAGSNLQRKWHGAFAMTLKSGLYNVTFIDTFGSTIPVKLEAGDVKRIPWASLMKNATSAIKIENPVLSVKFSPGEKTQKIHGIIKPLIIDGKIEVSKAIDTQIQFGDWKLDVVNPVWLKDAIPSENLLIERGLGSTTNVQTLFNKNIKWIINPYPGQMSVLELTLENKAPENFLVAPGQLNIPIPKKAKARFLISN